MSEIVVNFFMIPDKWLETNTDQNRDQKKTYLIFVLFLPNSSAKETVAS